MVKVFKNIFSGLSIKSLLFILYFYKNIVIHVDMFEVVELDVDKKYILLWEPPFVASTRPFKYFDVGNKIFKKFKCRYTNCFIRKNYQKLNQIKNATNYDAIMFNGKYLNKLTPDYLPKKRHPRQMYVFVQLEGADRFPVCPLHYENFFNLTITYRLDSDIPWTAFKVLTAIENATVGPYRFMEWMHYEDMELLNENDRGQLETKHRMGAFVSTCLTEEVGIDKYVKSLSDWLLKYSRMPIDIYGGCRKNYSALLHPALKKDYYFYLAMEHSHDRDFVSKKLSMAQLHNTVPVVYGGADYSKFAPPNSYLLATGMTPKKLAALMVKVMRNNYTDYFKWRNHYFYVDTHDLRGGVACQLCARLNEEKVRRRSHSSFRIWWNRRYEHPATCGLERRRYPLTRETLNRTSLGIGARPEQDMKTIFLWKPTQVFHSFGLGNKIFRDHNCRYDNCYISSSAKLDTPIERYDAVLIYGTARKGAVSLPKMKRSPKQLYIFVSHDSSERYPICSADYNDYFNMTMTYRLDSDIPWPYFDVITYDDTVIGPKDDVMWLEGLDMDPTSIELKIKLRKKQKLAAWFIDDCEEKKRPKLDVFNSVFSKHTNVTWKFVNKLNEELKRLGSKPIDIYGSCGHMRCPKNDPFCENLISDEYLFYLAFENSIVKDFVTDKLWRGFKNHAVPIVFGGAIYERFAPPDSYINALMLGPTILAKKMFQMLVYDRNEYYDFFKWRNHYVFKDNYYRVGQTTACKLCAKLNEHNGSISIGNFRSWWNLKWWELCEKK